MRNRSSGAVIFGGHIGDCATRARRFWSDFGTFCRGSATATTAATCCGGFGCDFGCAPEMATSWPPPWTGDGPRSTTIAVAPQPPATSRTGGPMNGLRWPPPRHRLSCHPRGWRSPGATWRAPAMAAAHPTAPDVTTAGASASSGATATCHRRMRRPKTNANGATTSRATSGQLPPLTRTCCCGGASASPTTSRGYDGQPQPRRRYANATAD